MKKKVLIISAVFAVIVAGILAGCGGGSDNGAASTTDTTITTSSHSKAEFIKLANGICNRERTRLLSEVGNYLKQHEDGGKSKAALIDDAMGAVVLPEVQTQIEEIRSLGAPSGDEQRIEELLAALQEVVDTGNQFTIQDFKRSAKLARAYGLESCAYVN